MKPNTKSFSSTLSTEVQISFERLIETAHELAILSKASPIIDKNALEIVWALALMNTPENMQQILQNAGAQLGLCAKPEIRK
jgi:hypothetical protein